MVYYPVLSNIKNNSPVYNKQGIKSGCCTGNQTFHERCYCAAKISFCKETCDKDEKCKGYVAETGGNCQIATTSKCPETNHCSKFSLGESNDLAIDSRCGSIDLEGCYIKKIGQ